MRYASVDEDVIRFYQDSAKHEATRNIQALAEEAEILPYTFSLVVVHGDPTLRITEQEKVQAADLLVIGKHGESVLEELLLGSVTKYVLTESQCDVLISVLPDGALDTPAALN
jgi:universal stress protein E